MTQGEEVTAGVSWPFGLAGRLVRAEKAVSRQEWRKARGLFTVCWQKVGQLRATGRPTSSDERRTLLGLVTALSALGDVPGAIGFCRAARGLGLADPLFYDYPCKEHVGSANVPGDEGVADLVAWTCWPGSTERRAQRQVVEALLKRALRPRRVTTMAAARALADLRACDVRWSWPHLYQAEQARADARWPEAAKALLRAAELESHSETKGELLWRAAQCFQLCPDHVSAVRAIEEARQCAPPPTAERWALAVRVACAVDAAGAGVSTAVDAVTAFPESIELVTMLTRACAAADAWAIVHAPVTRLLRTTRDNIAAVTNLACRVAVALRDEDLMIEVARTVAVSAPRVDMSANSILFRRVGEHVIALAVDEWNAASDTHVDSARRMARRVEAADRLGAPLSPRLRLWWAAVDHLSSITHTADAHVPPSIPAVLETASDQILAAYLEARRQGADWTGRAEDAVRRAPSSPLVPYVIRFVAAERAHQGRWSEAARLLAMENAPRSAVLAGLGAPSGLILWHEAAQAFAEGDFATAGARAVESVEAYPGACPATLALLTLASLAAARERGVEIVDTLAARAAPRLIESLANTGGSSAWAHAGRLGLWDLAGDCVARRLEEQPGSGRVLHAYALASLCRSKVAAGSAVVADPLLQALGAWTALSQQEEYLERFVLARLKAYGHRGRRIGASTLRDMMKRWVGDFAEKHATAVGLEPSDVLLLRDVEDLAAREVNDSGGLSLGPQSSDRLSAGPLLVAAMRWQKGVRDLIQRLDRDHTREEAHTTLLRRIEALTGIDLDEPAADRSEAGRLRMVRRLFSPLGPAVALVRAQRFSEAVQAIEAWLDFNAEGLGSRSRADALLASFVTGRSARDRFHEEAVAMLLDTHVGMARLAVAVVPVDPETLRSAWAQALEAGTRVGQRDDVAEGLAQIAVGRADLLWASRTTEERRRDRVDRRPQHVRAREGLQVLRTAWEMTRHPLVEGSFSKYLNFEAVRLANKKAFAEALDMLVEAIGVNHRARLACSNLVAIAVSDTLAMFEADADAAAELVVRLRERLETIRDGLPAGDRGEIQRCLNELGERTSTPFFNASGKALEREDLDDATSLMLLAALVGPDDHDVAQGLMHVRSELLWREMDGVPRAAECLQHLDRGRRSHGVQALQSVLQERAARRSARSASQLEAGAAEAADAGQFEQALQLLARARDLSPDNAAFRQNYENIGRVWMHTVIERDDPLAFLRALQVIKRGLRDG